MDDIVEVDIIGLIMDPVSKTPVMILKPQDNDRVVPIWIGVFEANAITMELESMESPRPMTHDLIARLLDDCHITVERIIINDLVKNTFFAQLHLCKDGECKVIDCRPSDAVAIALKMKAPMFVSRLVVESSQMSEMFSAFLSSEEGIDNWFSSLTRDDFGKYEH